MNKLEITMTWFYRLFIGWMPTFWEELPKEKKGKFFAGVNKINPNYFFDSHPTIKRRYGYKSYQKAYLKARWMALWVDFWTAGAEHGVEWIIGKDKRDV